MTEGMESSRKKRILVIGGSYFVGRMFCILADRSGGFKLDLINRGRFPFKFESVTEYKCDRYEKSAFAGLLKNLGEYDCVIDFCAYKPGDCASVIDAVSGRARQYIFISSCAVFAPSQVTKNESFPKVSIKGNDLASEYAYAKMLLEDETMERCAAGDVAFTIIRPSIIYGPFNYAPRESWYFDLMRESKPIPVPEDATGKFSMVYVEDVSSALMKCIGAEKAMNEDYILSGPEAIDYSEWTELIEGLSEKICHYKMPVRDVIDNDVPLPWSLDTNEVYDGSKLGSTFSLDYTSIKTGIMETYQVYQKVHGGS